VLSAGGGPSYPQTAVSSGDDSCCLTHLGNVGGWGLLLVCSNANPAAFVAGIPGTEHTKVGLFHTLQQRLTSTFCA